MPTGKVPGAGRSRARSRALLLVLAADVAFFGLCYFLFRPEPTLLLVILVVIVVTSAVSIWGILRGGDETPQAPQAAEDDWNSGGGWDHR